MKKKNRGKESDGLVGVVAGIHFVAYKLSLRGFVVLPATRHAEGIDLVVLDKRTGRYSAVQVITSTEMVTYWATDEPEKCLRGVADYYVCLRLEPRNNDFEAFVVNAEEVARQVDANVKRHRSQGRRPFANWSLPTQKDEIDKLHNAWDDLKS